MAPAASNEQSICMIVYMLPVMPTAESGFFLRLCVVFPDACPCRPRRVSPAPPPPHQVLAPTASTNRQHPRDAGGRVRGVGGARAFSCAAVLVKFERICSQPFGVAWSTVSAQSRPQSPDEVVRYQVP